MLHSGLAPAGALLRLTEHIGKLLMCMSVVLSTCLSKGRIFDEENNSSY